MQAVLRVLIGLTLASLAAAAVKVGHVITPSELAGLTGDALTARLSRFGELTLLTATHQSLFILPLALIATFVAELNRLRGWLTYAFIGFAIALAGLCVQIAGESELRTIVNPYALRAYMIEGICAGLVYWLVAGRFSGWRHNGALVKATPYPVAKPHLSVSDLDDSGPHDSVDEDDAPEPNSDAASAGTKSAR